jgi:rRNA-processing protein FCF1
MQLHKPFLPFGKKALGKNAIALQSPKQPITIVFDSNILVAIEQRKADVFSMARHLFGEKVQFAVTGQVMQELNELQGRGKTMAKAVKIALTALHKEKIGEIMVEARNADDSLVEAAEQGYCIASNDKALRKRIKGFGVAIMYLSKEKLLKIA